MMKKFLQTGVATMTAICMLVGLSAAMAKNVPAQAAGEQKNWTFSSVAVEDGTYSDVQPNVETIDEMVALGNSKFSGYVKFSAATGGALLFQNSNMPQLLVGVNSTNDVWQTSHIRFALLTANGQTFLACGVNQSNRWIFRDRAVAANEEIFLQVTFDYIDKDNDNAADDLQIKVWINGTQMTQVQQGYGNMDMLASSDDVCVMDYVKADNPIKAYVATTAGSGVNGSITVRSAHDVTVAGLEDGKTYCGAVTATVATPAVDGLLAKDLKQVTVGGTPVTLNNGSFTIPAGTGDTTVVVTDVKGTTQTYNVTVNTSHTWGTTYVSNNDATCKYDGTKSLQCTACGAVDTNEVADPGTKLDHVFETYVPDGDATCAVDGHETAECKYGCGEKDTRVAQGSATGQHTYGTDNKCTVCGADKPNDSQNGGTTGGTTTGGTTTGGTTTGGTTTGDATTGGTTTGESSVDTGDYSSVGFMLLLMVAAVATVAAVLKKRMMEQ